MKLLGNLLFLPIGLLFLPVMLINLYDALIHPSSLPLEELLGFAIFTVVFLFLGITFPNLYPDLATDDTGLYVKFYFSWLFVPWENIASFHEGLVSSFLLRSRKTYFVLVRDRLTIIHWIISLEQLGGWGPGFLVSQSISDYDQLVDTIKSNLIKR